MNKFGRKVSALLLAAAVAVSTVVPAFAANSPVSGNVDSNTTVAGTVQADNTVAVNKVTSTEKTATIPASITSSGKTYNVSEIKTGTIQKKYDKVTLVLNSSTKVDSKIAKSKKAKKTKKIVVKAAAGQKLKASQFDKKAFNGLKGKVIVKKSAMTKKQYDKLVKKLRKGGFNGKIVRQK